MKYDRDSVKEWVGDSQSRACRADLARFKQHGYSGWGSEGFWAIAVFRLQKAVTTRRPKWLWAPVKIGLNVLRKFLKILTLIELDPGADIGPGLLIPHAGNIHVNRGTKIGADCTINHGCTVGAGSRPGAATIGDGVLIGCSSSILGPVTIGDGAIIAANSLVITDVPANNTALGVPAKMYPPV